LNQGNIWRFSRSYNSSRSAYLSDISRW